MQAIWKKEEKLSPLRNEASLNFVSLRSHFNSVGRRGLSRVEMNALRAPLTTLYVSADMEIFFSLDTADAFIDGRLIGTDTAGASPKWAEAPPLLNQAVVFTPTAAAILASALGSEMF